MSGMFSEKARILLRPTSVPYVAEIVCLGCQNILGWANSSKDVQEMQREHDCIASATQAAAA